jgi:hypothetical protein
MEICASRVLDSMDRDEFVGKLRGGGVNQFLLCLKNYAHFKLFIENSMMIKIMQGSKQ